MRLLCIIAFLFLITSVLGQTVRTDYLRTVLGNLEKIESATYNVDDRTWEPGDTAVIQGRRFIKEYDNPQDSTIGANFLTFDAKDTTRLEFIYDGTVKVYVEHDKKKILIDDFTSRPLPFRTVSAPFFNYTKNIIKYALETKDSITLDVKDTGDDYCMRLVINEDTQVEFFGKAYHLPKAPGIIWDPTSIYEIWIGKSDNLPYKVKREMCHQISVRSCSEAQLNNLSVENFMASDYFPKGYEVKMLERRSNSKQASILIGKKAPSWVLKDAGEQEIALSDFKGKVLLIQITGIGCGPCQVSIPFLNKLKDSFAPTDFELVAIETWKKNAYSIQNYMNRHKIAYKMVSGTDSIMKDYQTGGAVPVFFLLDEHRIIRKVFSGYSPGASDKVIMDAIGELL